MAVASRRRFFQFLGQQAVVAAEEARGIRHIRLDLLPREPDSKVCQLIPRVEAGLRVFRRNGRVVVALVDGRCLTLFGVDDPRAIMFQLFNSGQSLGAISRNVASELGWTAAESTARVRALFVSLAAIGIVGTCNYWKE